MVRKPKNPLNAEPMRMQIIGPEFPNILRETGGRNVMLHHWGKADLIGFFSSEKAAESYAMQRFGRRVRRV